MNINIDLTDNEIAFLKQFASLQYEGAVDNLATRTPIHVVERKEETCVECSDGDVWFDDETEMSFDSFTDLIASKELPDYEDVEYTKINGITIYNYSNYCEAFQINARCYKTVHSYRPIAFFFTLSEAKRYMNGYQKHNCDNCRIYTYGLGYSNNGDMPVFRNFLMNIGNKLLDFDKT